MTDFRDAMADFFDAVETDKARRTKQVLDAAQRHIDRNAAAKKAATPPPQLRGQQIGDTYYVRADDLAALLDAKDVLPNLAASLRKKATK